MICPFTVFVIVIQLERDDDYGKEEEGERMNVNLFHPF